MATIVKWKKPKRVIDRNRAIMRALAWKLLNPIRTTLILLILLIAYIVLVRFIYPDFHFTLQEQRRVLVAIIAMPLLMFAQLVVAMYLVDSPIKLTSRGVKSYQWSIKWKNMEGYSIGPYRSMPEYFIVRLSMVKGSQRYRDIILPEEPELKQEALAVFEQRLPQLEWNLEPPK